MNRIALLSKFATNEDINNMEIVLDRASGFCFGVNNAIKAVEKYLSTGKKLYCLGEIVHNHEEVQRLEKKGLVVINHEDLNHISDCTVLIRAHGEPPSTYKLAKERNIEIIDATCPIVLKLQKDIKKVWEGEKTDSDNTIVIYGKTDHAEVVGLKGQTDNEAIIIEDPQKIHDIDASKHVNIFSQTTKDIHNYQKLIDNIKNKVGENNVTAKNTICRSVSNRVPQLKKFALECDCVIFVAGKNSSNGKALFAECKESNPKSYHISSVNELNPQWFTEANRVGVSGATSTPSWLMENVIKRIEELSK
ncbi:MAG: 4-hydroxy-3-methylbut-2-enyl diphosphate reductase [Hyphomicrobiales bacterium]